MSQIIVTDYQQMFIENSLNQDPIKAKEDFLTILRFIDCLTQDSATPYDENRNLSSMKQDHAKAIMKIQSTSQDLRVFKMTATILAQVQAVRLPAGQENLQNRLLSKFVALSEAGETMLSQMSDPNFNIQQKIQQIRRNLCFLIDLQPERINKKPFKNMPFLYFNGLSQEAQEQIQSLQQNLENSDQTIQVQSDDILANLAQITVRSTESGSDNQIDDNRKTQSKTKKIVQIQINDIDEWISQRKSDIIIKRQMKNDQIDEVVTLSQVAEEILEEQLQIAYDEYVLSGGDPKECSQPSRFKEVFAAYFEETACQIEASLLLSSAVKDSETYNLAIQCSLTCYRRLVTKEESFAQGSAQSKKFSNLMIDRVQNLIFERLSQSCINAISKSKNVGQEHIQQYSGHCVKLLQAMRKLIFKIKETKPPSYQGSCQAIKDFSLSQTKNSEEGSSFLQDVLSQIANIEVVQDSQNNVVLKLKREPEKEQADKCTEYAYEVSPILLTDQRFQTQFWTITQFIYETVSNVVRQNNLPSINAETQQKFLRLRKDLEVLAQRTMLKPTLKVQHGDPAQDNYYFAHHLDILRLIVHSFIRSAWVIEDLGAANEANQNGDSNIQTLIQFTCKMIRISDNQNFYQVITEQGHQKVNAQKDDLITFIYFLIRRLTLDNRGPSHPATYDQTILQSDLFKDDIFGKIMELQIQNGPAKSGTNIDRYNNSRLQTTFIQYLGGICSNDPAQIPKIIENGILQKVRIALKTAVPVNHVTNTVLLEFLRPLSIHEKGREFIKLHQLYENVIRPSTLPLTSAERKDHESDENNIALVILASNHEKYKKSQQYSTFALAELIRNSDPCFESATRDAVIEIISFLKPKALFLQKEYYQYLYESCQNPQVSYRQFQIEVIEKIISHYDYHIIKFELEKIHTLCYSPHFDQQIMLPILFKVISPDVLDQLLELFEIISTIKPVFDFAQKTEKSGSLSNQFMEIFNILIYQGRDGTYLDRVQKFEKRFRKACQGLADVFSEAIKNTNMFPNQEQSIKFVNLVDFLEGKYGPAPDICLLNKSVSSIDKQNLRGFFVANVLIAGQFLNVFEGTRKSTQENLCVTKNWSAELRILSEFMTSFNECNHQITDAFFKNKQYFIDQGIVTEEQIKEISINYSSNLTQEDKSKFQENRRRIEENIDVYRENLTYLNPEYININRLLQIVWDIWKAPQQRMGQSAEEQIKDSKKAYTKLTIENIKLLDKVIDDFQRLKDDFNSIEFLKTISRLYTYISELQQLINDEKLSGITFYEFVEEGCLSQLVTIFNIIKTFQIKRYQKEEDPQKQIKFIAVDCLQSINKQLKGVLTHFINCSPQLVNSTSPTMQNIVKEAGLYDSVQHFFANYIHNLVGQLVDHQSTSSSSLSEDSKATIPLYENKDLRQLQILLLQNISNGFEKCSFIKDILSGASSYVDGQNKEIKAKEAAKPKKVHHDESLISQITNMGFERQWAKKALKITQDLSSAVTFLLETGEGGLIDVSDSEEDNKKKDENEKSQNNETQLEEDQKQIKKKTLISIDAFKKYLIQIQETGLDVVNHWLNLSIDQAKYLPYKTQKKYSKLFDQYVLNLAKLPNKIKTDGFITIFDNIIEKYQKNVNKIQKMDENSCTAQSLCIIIQQTKNDLNLLHRLTRIESFEYQLRSNRKDSLPKLIDNVLKTLRALVDQNSAILNVKLSENNKMNEKKQSKDYAKFVYLSNVLELIYKSSLYLLVYQQTLESKKAKYENNLKDLEKKKKNLDKDTSNLEQTLRAKIVSVTKKFDEMNSKKIAEDTIQFLKVLQRNQSAINIPKKYENDIHQIIAQITDVSRLVYLQDIQKGSKVEKDLQIIQDPNLAQSEEHSKHGNHYIINNKCVGNSSLDAYPSAEENLNSIVQATSGTATLNIISIQKLAYKEERLQSQIEDIIKKIIWIKARSVQKFQKASKAAQENDLKSSRSTHSDDQDLLVVDQKNTRFNLKSFVTEFQVNVLGIGKTQNPAQNRYGAAPPQIQNISYPSNEQANQEFLRVFQQAIWKTCDVVVKQEKPTGDPNSESFIAQEKLLKAKNGKEALTNTQIQLKEEWLNYINNQKDQNDDQQIESPDDKLIYQIIFSNLKESLKPWFDELSQFIALQNPNSKKIVKIVKNEEDFDEKAQKDAYQQWRELSLIGLRNLSGLVRVFVDKSGGIISEISSDKSSDHQIQLLSWLLNAYLPLRVINREISTNNEWQEQNKNEENQSQHEIWYEIGQCSNLEKLDKNICLFLNELAGFGHLYCKRAKEQRMELRQNLLQQCLQTLQALAYSKNDLRQLNLLQQSQIISCLLVIQHLTNQYNQYEYNRVILSRECYTRSIRYLFEYEQQMTHGNQQKPVRFVQIINEILAKVVKTPTSRQYSQEDSEKPESIYFSNCQNFSQLIIERSLKIFTTIALFVESEKKREKHLKEQIKKKKQQRQEKTLKKAEEKSQKGSTSNQINKSIVQSGQQRVAPTGEVNQQMNSDQQLNNAQINNEDQANEQNDQMHQDFHSANDAQMNAYSDDDDDDMHGEGSLSQQQDLQIIENQLLQQQQQLIALNNNNQIEEQELIQEENQGEHPDIDQNFQLHEEEDDYDGDADDQDPDEEDDHHEDEDDDQEENNFQIHNENELIRIQQEVNMRQNDINNELIADEDEEDEEGIFAEEIDENDEDAGELPDEDQDDEDLEDDLDDLPSDEDEGDLFLPMVREPNVRQRPLVQNSNSRDILFNLPDNPALAANGLFVGDPRHRPERHGLQLQIRVGGHAIIDQPLGYGPNWSREEEEVSQTLRNLRGLSMGSASPNIPVQFQNPQTLREQNCRYRIELDINKQYADQNNQQFLNQTKKSIEQIKLEQSKATNNDISTIFQILKPIDLRGHCTIAQAIDQEFLKCAISREKVRIEHEKNERKDRIDRRKKGETLDQEEQFQEEELENGLFGEESEDEDNSVLVVQNNPGQIIPPPNVFREFIARGDHQADIQERLNDIRMDIERILQEGMAVGQRNPFLEIEEQLGGLDDRLGHIFGGPPGQRQNQRDRERVNQANVQRDVRDQSMNWDSSLFQQPEANEEENCRNLIQNLIEVEDVVVETVEVPVAPAKDDQKSSEESQPRPPLTFNSGDSSVLLRQPPIDLQAPQRPNAPQRPQREERKQAALEYMNLIIDGARPNQDNQNQNQLGQEDQLALGSFFASLNQRNQPPQQEVPGSEPELAQALQNNNEPLLGGLNGLNQALDQIRDQMQNSLEELENAAQRITSQHQQNPPVLQQEQNQQEVIGEDGKNQQAVEQVHSQDQLQQQEEQKQNLNPQPPEVEMTFGYPNTLLRENDIDPTMLYEFPEELRVEILSGIQVQYEEWLANQQNQNAGDAQEQPLAEQNAQSNPPATQASNNVQEHQQEQQDSQQPPQLQPQTDQSQQPVAQQQQEQQPVVVDPELAEAIALGLDPDFLSNMPPELRRELIQDESFRAANTGVPQPNRAPQREAEVMDVASIIATAQDPAIRREMLQNLTQAQIDVLPSALRSEALNLRRGHQGLYGQRLLAENPGGLPRHPRNLEQMMMGHRLEQEERNFDGFMNSIRREGLMADDRNKQKNLTNPQSVSHYQLLMDFTQELDEKISNELVLCENQKQNLNEITEQLLEDRSFDKLNDDRLLRNILTTVCLNPNVKTDIIQLLRLILKQKLPIQGESQGSQTKTIDYGYQIRNKVINTLTFVLKIAANKDTDCLLSLFEIEIQESCKDKVKFSDFQWNKIFLTVTGILRVLIDNNKKLILHMLKCLIQKDEYFVSKGDHLLSSHSRLLQQSQSDLHQSCQAIKPPLAEIIQIMREQSEQYHKLSKNKNQSEEEKLRTQDYLVKIRNVKLLIQDIFKQFDLLYNEINFQQISNSMKKNAQAQSQGINFGELSQESVKSLTDLLYLSSIDKKLLSALGDFMYRLSSLKNLGSSQKNEEKNLRNWSMIQKQCQKIGQENLQNLNDLLYTTIMTLGTFNIQINKAQNQIQERQMSQISSGAVDQEADQAMTESESAAKIASSKHKINKNEEDQLKDLLEQFKADSAPLVHILFLYSFFYQKFSEEKLKLSTQIGKLDLKIIEHEKQLNAVQQKKDVKDENPMAESSLKEQQELLSKSLEADKKQQEEAERSFKQKDDFIRDIKLFFQSQDLSQIIQQIQQVLNLVQNTDKDFFECSKYLVNCVFDCFMPEMQEEVIKIAKLKEKKISAGSSNESEESKYVSMERIQKVTEENQNQDMVQNSILDVLEDTELKKENTEFLPPSKVKDWLNGDPKSIKVSKKFIFRDIDFATERLYRFNVFCQNNKVILNKIVQNIHGNQREREREREIYQTKDISTVAEQIKYMYNVLDFDTKRILFKKEIKRMRKASSAKSLTLYIRRKEIFMDAYFQLSHLTPNELKGKIQVEFTGERGQDIGGLTRDFFIELSKEMFNQNYSLFKNSDNGATYMPNPKSYVQPEHIKYFKFIGRVIGKALFEGCNLECYFVRSIYKMLIGQKLNFKDLEDQDNQLFEGLNWCLKPSSSVDELCGSFSTNVDYFGRTETIDLIPGGRDIDVTNENKEYHVERKAYFHLYKSVQPQIDAFLEGFYEIIPRDLVSMFSYKELELMISGLHDYQISDLKANTNYTGYTADSPQIQWFWEIMETFDRTEKGNLLQFVTGSSKVPVEGFAMLKGMHGPEKFQIYRSAASNDPMRLPVAHTCFNQLDLPEYPSKEVLHERLLWAIKETAGFGFA